MNLEKTESKRIIGNQYEEKAALALEAMGYQILEKNVNYRWGEIDLVAVDLVKNELVFAEVRHRAVGAMSTPAESVSKGKRMRLRRAIDTYLVSPAFEQRGLKLKGARVDLIAFEGDRMEHWQNFMMGN